jgi:hypothetical protein
MSSFAGPGGACPHNALGNRTAKNAGLSGAVSYSYDAGTKRLSSASSLLGYPEAATFSFDNAGNMTGDGVFTFGYSSRNMMLAATLTSTGAKTRYQYDGDGLRALKSGPSDRPIPSTGRAGCC